MHCQFTLKNKVSHLLQNDEDLNCISTVILDVKLQSVKIIIELK